MKEYKQIIVSATKDCAEDVVNFLAHGWRIETTIPVGEKSIVVFAKEKKFNPDERIDFSNCN